jgi:hypothetical protein
MNNQRYLLTLLGLFTAAILIGGYFLLGLNERDQLVGNVVAEVVILIVAPMVWYYLFARRGISFTSMQSETKLGAVVSFYPEHDQVDWGAIIRRARRLDVVVHYYDRWVRRNDRAFVDFFQRGGELRLVLPDRQMPALMEVVREQYFEQLRMDELMRKIEATETKLCELFDEAGNVRSRIVSYHFPRALHYSFVLVDSRTLYLSMYEQFRGNNVRSSVFGIDLTKDRELETYWLANREAFFDRSRVGVDA